jgi:beta-phosphoglucomutase-like phosphatase (HAD superfamily)
MKPDHSAFPPFNAAIFDMDGLMLDSERLALDCWREAARRLDIPMHEEAILGMLGMHGTYEANMKVSKNRAYAVENYLQDCGVSPAQFKKVEGVGYNEYDESLSADQNRRVEVYMYASEQMIKNAEAAN